MQLTRERDAEIGRDLHRRLHGVVRRLVARQGISAERAADYLLTGSLFVAAELTGRDLDDTVELAAELVRSVQEDDLPAATRH